MPRTAEELEEEKHSLSLLSDAEREAMEEDDDDTAAADKPDADADKAKPEAKDDPDADDEEDDDPDAEEGDQDDDDADDAADEKTAKPEEKVEDEAAAETAKEPDAVAEQEIESIPLDLKPIEDQYQRRIEELDAHKAEQIQKLMDGELAAADYAKIESQYMRDRDAARDDKTNTIGWFKETNAFMNDALKDDGVNYHADPKLNAALDRWVKVLAGDPENAEKPGVWFLQQAHENVKLQYKIGAKTTGDDGAKDETKPAAEAKPKVTVKPKGRAPDLSKIPPTLSGVPPAAESEAGDDGEFSHLEKLSGMEFERAIARLTPEQKDRYERDN